MKILTIAEVCEKANVNDNIHFDGFFVLSEAEVRTGANGKTFLNCRLSDNSGSCAAKFWEYFGSAENFADKIVKIRGKGDVYQGTPQIIIEQIRLVNESDGVDIEQIVPTAPVPFEDLREALDKMLETIQDPDYSALVKKVCECYGINIVQIPAAKSIHHAFLHGLLMHTTHMMILCDTCAKIYPYINRDLLLSGAFLHDLGKLEEFTVSELGTVSDYSVSGNLLGHLYLGAVMVRDMCRELNISEEKTMLIEHMLLSHHGEPEYGAAVKPKFAEAELLSRIDMLDSRAEIFRTVDAPEGSFSKPVTALDRRSIYKIPAANTR